MLNLGSWFNKILTFINLQSKYKLELELCHHTFVLEFRDYSQNHSGVICSVHTRLRSHARPITRHLQSVPKNDAMLCYSHFKHGVVFWDTLQHRPLVSTTSTMSMIKQKIGNKVCLQQQAAVLQLLYVTEYGIQSGSAQLQTHFNLPQGLILTVQLSCPTSTLKFVLRDQSLYLPSDIFQKIPREIFL